LRWCERSKDAVVGILVETFIHGETVYVPRLAGRNADELTHHLACSFIYGEKIYVPRLAGRNADELTHQRRGRPLLSHMMSANQFYEGKF